MSETRTVKLYVVYVKFEWNGKVEWKRTLSHPDKEKAVRLAQTLRKLFPFDEFKIELEEKVI